METFDSFSFGCRVNQAEIEAINSELIQKGYKKDGANPDLYIINTCSVTKKAEREARKLIYKVSRENPKTKIIVTGCAATNWSKTNTKVDGVDYLIDNKGKEYVVELLEKKYKKIDSKIKKINKFDSHQINATDRFMRSGRVVVKIQDGCHRFCTYCIVPYLRGLPKSKKISEIISVINQYPDYSESILTAINTEAFGRDTKENFLDLIDKVLEKTNIPRISFGSIHPWSIDDNFIKKYKNWSNDDRFVDFFHIPLQSGSNKMLNLMKRDYTREDFIERLEKIKDINEMAFIGTDVIVGFLEEKDSDFEDTYNFLEQTPISKFHVFRFSKREHTAAYHLSKRLEKPDVNKSKERSKRLRDLSRKKFLKFQQNHINKLFKALILEKEIDGLRQVVLSNNMLAYAKIDKDFTGEIKRVKIESCKKGLLFCKMI